MVNEEIFILCCLFEGLYSIIYVNKIYKFLIYSFGIVIIVLYLSLICKRRGL